MNIRRRLLLAVVTLAATAVAGRANSPRDVIADAWRYPFVTDAEVLLHTADGRGVIRSAGGDVLIRYPSIHAALVDGERRGVKRVGPDLGRLRIPAGRHEVRLKASEPFPEVSRSVNDAEAVKTADAFEKRAASLQAGQQLVIADGVHRNWRVKVNAEGKADRPIIVRPETPGGAILQGRSRLVISGAHIIVRGLRFENCGPHTVLLLTDASDCRITQCQFFYCGNPGSTFGHIASVGMGCHRNRVDHCFFKGSKSMSLGQRIHAGKNVGRDNRFDHNIFRDIFRYWRNGQENIQLGQNQRDRGKQRPHTTVEYNLFDHAWGDSEIISNKCSGNVITHNVAAHCPHSAFTLRGGNDVRFDGNVIADCRGGVIVMGRRHEIVNNLIIDGHSFGVRLDTGSKKGRMQIAADHALVANNTIVNCAHGVMSRPATDGRPHIPEGCRIVNNLLVSDRGTLLNTGNLKAPIVRRNLCSARGVARVGAGGEEAILDEPRLTGNGRQLRPKKGSPPIDAALRLSEVNDDRWDHRRPHGAGPDIGADEVGAVNTDRAVSLPPIPPRPLLAPSLYRGEAIYTQTPDQPLASLTGEGLSAADSRLVLADGEMELERKLPADVVVGWQFRPKSWKTQFTASLTDAEGDGYSLRWGGLADDDQPRCVFELIDASDGELLAAGPDVLNFYREFRRGWGFRRAKPQPGPQWYDMLLLKHGQRIYALVGEAGHVKSRRPIIAWNGREREAGDGTLRLRIRQTGKAEWRNLRAWRYEYTGDTPPSPPPGLQAKEFGGGRIELTWGDDTYCGKGYKFRVERRPTGEENDDEDDRFRVIAEGIRNCRCNDFTVTAGREYVYRVTAFNALGLSSDAVSVRAAAGHGGAAYRLIHADEVTELTAPLNVSADDAGPRFLWAPKGIGYYTDKPPEEGLARYQFEVQKAGDYDVWALVGAPDAATNSFYVSLDGGEFRTCYLRESGGWAWRRILRQLELSAGTHTLSFKHRESGTKLAAILITDDSEFSPDVD